MKPVLDRWWHVAIPFFCGALAPMTVAGPSYAIAFFIVLVCTFLLAPILIGSECKSVLLESFQAWRTPTACALAAFFVIALAGLILSGDPARSATVWLRTIFYLAMGAVIWRYFRDRYFELELAFYFFLVLFVIAGAIAWVSLYVWPGLIGILTLQGPEVPITTARLALKSHSVTLTCLAPVICWLAWRRGGTWRAFSLAYPALVYVIGIGANKQAVAMTLICGLLGMILGAMLQRLRWKSAMALIAISGLAVLGILAFVWIHLPSYPQERYSDFYFAKTVLDHHRQVIWAFALNHIQENFWLGIGLDTSNFLPGANSIVAQFNQEYLPSHPHNFILEVWLETGIFGLIALLTAIGALLWAIYGRLRDGKPGAVAATGFFAAFWNANLYNFSFWSSWWLIIFITVMAMLFAIPSKDEAVTRPDN